MVEVRDVVNKKEYTGESVRYVAPEWSCGETGRVRSCDFIHGGFDYGAIEHLIKGDGSVRLLKDDYQFSACLTEDLMYSALIPDHAVVKRQPMGSSLIVEVDLVYASVPAAKAMRDHLYEIQDEVFNKGTCKGILEKLGVKNDSCRVLHESKGFGKFDKGGTLAIACLPFIKSISADDVIKLGNYCGVAIESSFDNVVTICVDFGVEGKYLESGCKLLKVLSKNTDMVKYKAVL